MPFQLSGPNLSFDLGSMTQGVLVGCFLCVIAVLIKCWQLNKQNLTLQSDLRRLRRHYSRTRRNFIKIHHGLTSVDKLKESKLELKISWLPFGTLEAAFHLKDARNQIELYRRLVGTTYAGFNV